MEKRLKLAVYTDSVQAHAAISRDFPQVDVRIETTSQGFAEAARQAEVVFTSRKYERHLLLDLPKLRWLHLGGTGVDRLRPFDDLDPDVIITNTPGLNAEMMADYVMCVITMLIWDFPRLMANQLARHWEKWTVERTASMTLALVGLRG
jgi:phosphoglycerate dehydrogenase-like enzyme